jgi:hypothetical protein
MELHLLRTIGCIKVSGDRIGDHFLKFRQRLALSGDSTPSRLIIPAGHITARFLTGRDVKDDPTFCHGLNVGQGRFLRKSSPRDGGNDAHLVPRFDGRLLVLEEADVFAIDVNVDETAQVALRVEEPFADAGVALVEAGEEFADGGALDLDDVEMVGQGPERGGDGDGDGHTFLTGLTRLTGFRGSHSRHEEHEV